MNKVLFVASVAKKHINVFHTPYLKWFQQKGYETHVCASNDFQKKNELFIPYCNKYHDVSFSRNPISLKNIHAIHQLRKVIKNNNYEIIHCHTPIGGALTRLSTIGLKNKKPKIIYTAHGFHFFKGSSIISWFFYYPIEKFLSNFTDVIITINKEDYMRAKKFNNCQVEFIPGVGVDTKKYEAENFLSRFRDMQDINMMNKTIILSVGELNSNKNHSAVLKALALVDFDNILYLICGEGKLEKKLLEQIEELSLSTKVKLLGFQSNLSDIYAISDIFVFPSKREGLSVSLMEAMSAALPVVASNVRGNTDLIEDGVGGYLVNPKNIEAIKSAIEKLIIEEESRKAMGQHNIEKIKQYDKTKVIPQMAKLYESLMKGDSN